MLFELVNFKELVQFELSFKTFSVKKILVNRKELTSQIVIYEFDMIHSTYDIHGNHESWIIWNDNIPTIIIQYRNSINLISPFHCKTFGTRVKWEWFISNNINGNCVNYTNEFVDICNRFNITRIKRPKSNYTGSPFDVHLHSYETEIFPISQQLSTSEDFHICFDNPNFMKSKYKKFKCAPNIFTIGDIIRYNNYRLTIHDLYTLPSYLNGEFDKSQSMAYWKNTYFLCSGSGEIKDGHVFQLWDLENVKYMNLKVIQILNTLLLCCNRIKKYGFVPKMIWKMMIFPKIVFDVSDN
jgi:hypothetical protein